MPKETSRRKFQYAERSEEDVRRRAKQSSSKYDSIFNKNVPYYTARDGENEIRIVPWIDQGHPDFKALTAEDAWDNHWGISVMIHRNVGPLKGTYLCLDKMKGEPCPICEVWKAEDAKDLGLSDRVLAWIIDRKNEKAGPQLFNMPLQVSKDISLASDQRGGKGVLRIDSIDEGHDIFFDKEGKDIGTRYKQIEVVKDPSYLHDNEDKQNDWLDFIMDNCLPDLLNYYEADYLEKLLSGQIEKDDDDEGSERGSDRGSSRSSRRPSRDDDNSEREARPSRRGRGEESEPEPEERGSRRGREPEEGGREEFTRPARRGREEASEPRGSRRGRGTEAEEPSSEGEGTDEAPERESEPRGRGGRTERYRPKEDEPGDDGKEVEAARGRLRSVGRRSGR